MILSALLSRCRAAAQSTAQRDTAAADAGAAATSLIPQTLEDMAVDADSTAVSVSWMNLPFDACSIPCLDKAATAEPVRRIYMVAISESANPGGTALHSCVQHKRLLHFHAVSVVSVRLLYQVRDLIARRGQAALTREERRRRQRSLDSLGAPSFQAVMRVCSVSISSLIYSLATLLLAWNKFSVLSTARIQIAQKNLGRLFGRLCARKLQQDRAMRRTVPVAGMGGWYTVCLFCRQEHGARPLLREPAAILQINIGLYCNQVPAECCSSGQIAKVLPQDTAAAYHVV